MSIASTSTASPVRYLTGCSTELTRQAGRPDLGLLVTPATSLHLQIPSYGSWGADNGCYSESKKGRPFDGDAWLRWLERLPQAGCLFAALPDVLEWFVDPETGRDFCVGNLEATLERSERYADRVRSLGLPVALVAQDGLLELAQIPFEVDALFVGGSDGYKLGPDAAALVGEAGDAGLWTHIGRVNSYKRMAYCASIGADSADGTFVGFAPRENYGRMIGWLDRLAEQA